MHLFAGHLFEAVEFLREVRQPYGVVQNAVGAIVVAVGATHNADHGKVLTDHMCKRKGGRGRERERILSRLAFLHFLESLVIESP